MCTYEIDGLRDCKDKAKKLNLKSTFLTSLYGGKQLFVLYNIYRQGGEIIVG